MRCDHLLLSDIATCKEYAVYWLRVPPGTALIYVKLEFPQFPFDVGIDKPAR
jgi:hypothetical protein